MDESRRERKKRQTRRLIAETAVRLFAEQGYEQTTVAQIASAADVATKTFFNHFPSKDDVLFEDTRRHRDVALAVIADRDPRDGITELLGRVYDAMMDDYLDQGVGGRDKGLMETYTELLVSVPALQAKALHQSVDLQRRIAEALADAFPDELDPVSAGAVVGSMVGAVQGAALASMERDQSQDQLFEAMRRGRDIALRGLHAF
ncbi:TetR/AcrR family transcriptional regulator [Nocardiopsis sediminis]|uniref:TetR/AcrR family transcriptional regulator n=1 Tax=Nocardiopsis sediminis TaxID=1778267 RepID=A0ABV8FNC0_9ACTN